MMKTLLIHTPENYTSVSSLTEPKAVQESMEKHETSYFETSVLTHARKRFYVASFSDAFCHSYRNYYYQI